MKITYAQVQNRNFSAALSKLATFGGFTDYKELANIKAIIKQFEKIAQRAQEDWTKLLKDYCVLDDKGELKLKDGGIFDVLPGKEVELKNKKDIFDQTEKEIWAKTIPWESVQKVGLSAGDLIQLEGIVLESKEFLEEMKAESVSA